MYISASCKLSSIFPGYLNTAGLQPASVSVKPSTTSSHTTHQFLPGAAAALQQPSSHSSGTIQPHLQRPHSSRSHPMTPLVFNLDSSPLVSSGQSSTLLYTPAEATSHGRQHHHDNKKTAHRARTSVNPRYQTIPESLMSSASTSTLAPTSRGNLTISSMLSTSGQSDRSEVVTGQEPCGELESSRTPNDPSPPTTITTTQQGPTLTLTELDELWRRFLATSLGSQQPPLSHNQTSGRREMDHPTTAAATGSERHSQFTYHRSQVIPTVPPSVATSQTTRMQDRYTELLATHGKREGNVSKSTRAYTETRHIHPPSNTKGKPVSCSRPVHMQDTSVQTTPSLHVPHPPLKSAISFSIPKQQTPIIEEREKSLEQRTVRAAFHHQLCSKSEPPSSPLQHTLTQLTLHEALTVFRPDFIQRSCERQRALREGQWRRRRRERGHRPPPVGCREEVPQSKRTPKFFFVGESSPRFLY